MTHPKTKETLIRLAWLTELRRQGERKCKGKYFNGTSVCALGLLAEIAGIPPSDAEDLYVRDIGVHAGLNIDQCEDVWRRNDGMRAENAEEYYHAHTFSEIADVVESWFK